MSETKFNTQEFTELERLQLLDAHKQLAIQHGCPAAMFVFCRVGEPETDESSPVYESFGFLTRSLEEAISLIGCVDDVRRRIIADTAKQSGISAEVVEKAVQESFQSIPIEEGA
jgi:hypothetical protein